MPLCQSFYLYACLPVYLSVSEYVSVYLSSLISYHFVFLYFSFNLYMFFINLFFKSNSFISLLDVLFIPIFLSNFSSLSFFSYVHFFLSFFYSPFYLSLSVLTFSSSFPFFSLFFFSFSTSTYVKYSFLLYLPTFRQNRYSYTEPDECSKYLVHG